MNEHPALEAVADAAILVETTTQAPESANTAFERRFAAPERNPFFGWNPPPQPIHHHILSEVVLDGQFRGLFKSGRFIPGTGNVLPDQQAEARPATTAADGTAIIGCNSSHANPFHWITQSLPAIDVAMRREGQDRRTVLVLPPMTPWQEESLRILGYAETRRIPIDRPEAHYALARAEFSEYLTGQAAFRLSRHARDIYARLRDSVPVSLSEGRRLYLAGTDGPIRNEAALIDALRQRGFDIVTPSGLSLTEQIRLFRNAGVVVGPHGAALTSIALCDPGTIVYELVPAHAADASFCNLAHSVGLHYWADKFGENAAWEADIEAVLRRLDEIEAVRSDLLEAAQQRTISAMDFLRGRPGMVSPVQGEQAAPAQARQGWFRRLRGGPRQGG